MSDHSLEGMQAAIVRCLPKDSADLRFKPMFGGAMGYIQDRPFASLSSLGLGIKLSPNAQDELLKVEGAKRLQYPGDPSPSKQYIWVPGAWLENNDTLLTPWLERSADYVVSLPLTKKKPKSLVDGKR
jgi:hypothetical protein